MENNIIILRLFNGEMIIGKLVSTTDQSYQLEDPRSILMMPTLHDSLQIALKSICSPFVVKRLEKEISIPIEQVMFAISNDEIDKDLITGYQSEISGIKIVTAADAMAVNSNTSTGDFIL